MSQQHDVNERINQWLAYAAWFLADGMDKFEKWKSTAREAREHARLAATLAGTDVECAERDALLQNPFEAPIENPDEIEEIICGPDPAAWELLRKLVSAAPNDPSMLEYIGAGVFENWAREVRTEEVIAELLNLIRKDPKWQLVARNCWHSPPTVQALLESL